MLRYQLVRGCRSLATRKQRPHAISRTPLHVRQKSTATRKEPKRKRIGRAREAESEERIIKETDESLKSPWPKTKMPEMITEDEPTESPLADMYEKMRDTALKPKTKGVPPRGILAKEVTASLTDKLDSMTESEAVYMSMNPQPHKLTEDEANAPILATTFMEELPVDKYVVETTERNFSIEEETMAEFFKYRGRDGKNYTRYIRGQAEKGKYAYEAIEDMKMRGVKRRVQHYTSLMYATTKNADPNQAFDIMDKMRRDGLVPNIYCYDIAINACIAANQLDRGFFVVNHMIKEGISLTPVPFASLIRGCIAEEDYQRAWETYDHMSVWHCQADQVVYALMIRVCGRQKRHEKALQLFDTMRELKVWPDAHCFDSLLNTLDSWEHCKEAWNIMETMKEEGFTPSYWSMIAFMKAVAKGGDVKTAELMYDEIMQMPEAQKFDHAPATLMITYSNAFKLEEKKQEDYVARTETIFERFRDSGQKITIHLMNARLRVYTEAYWLDHMLDVFNEYEKYGLKHNVTTYNELIKAFMWCKIWDRGFDMFNYMKAAGLEPNERTYWFMVEGCTRTRHLQSAIKFLEEMRAKKFYPNFSNAYVKNLRGVVKKWPDLRLKVDELTYRVFLGIPSWTKPGRGRQTRSEYRTVTKEEYRKHPEPHWDQVANTMP